MKPADCGNAFSDTLQNQIRFYPLLFQNHIDDCIDSIRQYRVFAEISECHGRIIAVYPLVETGIPRRLRRSGSPGFLLFSRRAAAAAQRYFHRHENTDGFHGASHGQSPVSQYRLFRSRKCSLHFLHPLSNLSQPFDRLLRDISPGVRADVQKQVSTLRYALDQLFDQHRCRFEEVVVGTITPVIVHRNAGFPGDIVSIYILDAIRRNHLLRAHKVAWYGVGFPAAREP